MKKKLVIIIGLVVLFLASAFVVKGFIQPKKQGRFEFSAITTGDLENIVSSSGTLSAVETVEVGSQVSGIIEKLHVDYNDRVTKGQVLAELDKTLFAVSVRDAEAGVMRAKARLAQAEAEYKRNRPLCEKGHLSEMEFLVTKTTLETARADLETAKAALKRAQTNLQYTVIRSPVSGTVIERTVEAGQTIAAAFQAPKLFVIARDLTRMQIETNVDESDIGYIRKKQSVRFTVQAYPDETFTGKVRQVRLQPTTIQNVVNYTVVVDAANETRKLLPGMTATADFLVEEKRDVLLVPNAALTFTPSIKMMAQYKDQLMAKMKKNGNGGMGMPGMMRPGMGTSTQSKDGGRVFYLDKAGVPAIATLKKGATDGRSTEVIDSAQLKEGMQVITSFKETKNSSSKSNSSMLIPKPPRGNKY